jgi:hypothetical protein
MLLMSTPPTPRRAITPLLPVLFAFGILMIFFPTIMNLAQLALHAKWQSADAEITDVRLNSHYSRKGGDTWNVQCICKYSVQGRDFSAPVEPLGLGTTTSDRDMVLRFARAHPRGSHHKILYNPASPYEAMWSPDFDTFLNLWVLWKLALGVAAALVIVLLISKLKAR